MHNCRHTLCIYVILVFELAIGLQVNQAHMHAEEGEEWGLFAMTPCFRYVVKHKVKIWSNWNHHNLNVASIPNYTQVHPQLSSCCFIALCEHAGWPDTMEGGSFLGLGWWWCVPELEVTWWSWAPCGRWMGEEELINGDRVSMWRWLMRGDCRDS